MMHHPGFSIEFFNRAIIHLVIEAYRDVNDRRPTRQGDGVRGAIETLRLGVFVGLYLDPLVVPLYIKKKVVLKVV